MLDRDLRVDHGRKAGPPSRDKVRSWQEKYVLIRPQVITDIAAYKRIAEEDEDIDRQWDYRTVRSHLEKQLPLGPANALRTAADFIAFMESKRPLQQVLSDFEEAAPIRDVAAELEQVVLRFVSENPKPDQGLRALASLLSGGFPLG